jgi:hypothetical protein
MGSYTGVAASRVVRYGTAVLSPKNDHLNLSSRFMWGDPRSYGTAQLAFCVLSHRLKNPELAVSLFAAAAYLFVDLDSHRDFELTDDDVDSAIEKARASKGRVRYREQG